MSSENHVRRRLFFVAVALFLLVPTGASADIPRIEAAEYDDGGSLWVQIRSDESLTERTAYALDGQKQLVIDIGGAVHRIPSGIARVAHSKTAHIRIAQLSDKVRIIVDGARGWAQYGEASFTDSPDGLLVSWGDGSKLDLALARLAAPLHPPRELEWIASEPEAPLPEVGLDARDPWWYWGIFKTLSWRSSD